MKKFIAFRIGMVAGIVACGLLDVSMLGFIPIACLAIYTFFGYRDARGKPQRLEALGVQVFFTAYTAAVAAFAGMVLRTHLWGHTRSGGEGLWLLAALGILCTVLGLLTMTTLQDLATQAQPLANTLAPAHSRPDEVTELIETQKVAFQQACEKAANEMISVSAEITTTLRDVNAQLHGLSAAFQNVVTGSKDAEEAVVSMRKTNYELKGVLEAYIRNLAVRIDPPDDGSQARVQ